MLLGTRVMSVLPLYLCHFSSLCHQAAAAAASGGSVTIKGKSRQRSRVITKYNSCKYRYTSREIQIHTVIIKYNSCKYTYTSREIQIHSVIFNYNSCKYTDAQPEKYKDTQHTVSSNSNALQLRFWSRAANNASGFLSHHQ